MLVHLRNWISAAILLVTLDGAIQAQPPSPGGGGIPRPSLSPYLNLARTTGNPAINYYGLVRPQLQFERSLQNLQGAVNTNQQMIGNLSSGTGGLSETGHGAGFMNYGAYFMNAQGAGAPTRGGGGRPGTSGSGPMSSFGNLLNMGGGGTNMMRGGVGAMGQGGRPPRR